MNPQDQKPVSYYTPTPEVLWQPDPTIATEAAAALQKTKAAQFKTKTWLMAAGLLSLCLFSLLGLVVLVSKNNQQQKDASTQYQAASIDLGAITASSKATLGQLAQLDVNGTLKINGSLVLSAGQAPTNPQTGEIYFDSTTSKVYYYDGSQYQSVAPSSQTVTSIAGLTGNVRLNAGPGVSVSGATITNTGVTKFGGATGNITLGSGLSITNNQLVANVAAIPVGVSSIQGQTGSVSLLAGTGISITGTTITNGGVTELANLHGSIKAGRGLHTTGGDTLESTISVTTTSSVLSLTDDGNGNIALSHVPLVLLSPAAPQTDAGITSSIYINKTAASGNLLQLQKSGANVLTLGNTGNLTLQNTIDSTTAFQVKDTSNNSVLSIDTTNSNITTNTNTLSLNTINATTITADTANIHTANGTTIKSTADNTTALQVQNAAGSSIMSVDTLNKKVSIDGGQSQTLVSTWGTSNYEIANATTATSDGGYVIAGYEQQYQGAFVTKYDSNNTIEWSKSISDNYYVEAKNIIQTSDGGYAVTGELDDNVSTTASMFIAKLDATGNLSWLKISSSGDWNNYWSYGLSLIQTSDGGYAITGEYWDGIQNIDAMFLAKYDTSGNLSWFKTWGGSGSWDAGNSLIQTSDGGYAIAGQTNSYGAGGQDAFIAKYDATGNLTWNKTWGGNGTDGAYGIIQTSDGGYATAGYTDSFGVGYSDAFIAKYDATGNLTWNKTWGGTEGDEARSIIQTADGGYAIAGITSSSSPGHERTLIVKYDATGNLTWNKTWGAWPALNHERAYGITQTIDGGYVITGGTSNFGAGDYDAFIAKYDSSGNIPGCLSVMCQTPVATETSPVATETSPVAAINSFSPATASQTPTIYDMMGIATATAVVNYQDYGFVVGGSSQFNGNTTNNGNVTTIGDTYLTGSLVLNNMTNTNTVTLLAGVTNANYTLTLPTDAPADGQCLTNTTGGQLQFQNCGGYRGTWDNSAAYSPGAMVVENGILYGTVGGVAAGGDPELLQGDWATIGTTNLQVAYSTNTNYATAPDIKLDGTRGGIDIQDANTSLNDSLLTVRASNALGFGASLFDINSTGQTTFSNTVNSTTALQVQSAGGTSVVNVDTKGKTLTVGNASDPTSLFADKVSNNGANGMVISADFNGDGSNDIAGRGFGGLYVRINNGDGTFASNVSYPVGSMSFGAGGVASGDVDQDGFIDLIVTNGDDGTVSVLLGIGDGTFAPRVNYATGVSPYGLSVADVNNDSYVDLVVPNASSATVSILLNNGDGTFATKVDYATNGRWNSKVADFNNDGYADIVITSWSQLSVLLNNGDGTFAPYVNYGGSPGSRWITIADFNSDGYQDFATNGQDWGMNVFLNNGDGTFASPIANITPNIAGGGITSADYNYDGKQDIIVTGSVMYVFFGNGDGTFTLSQTYSNPTGGAVSADFDGNGTPDIATDGGIYINNLIAVKATAPATVTVYANASGADAIRVNGVNNSQLFKVDVGGNTTIGGGIGAGLFEKNVDYGTYSGAIGISTADVNNDGKQDVITANLSANTVSVLLNSGDGTFAPKVDYAAGGNIWSITVADLNYDNYPDIIVGHIFSGYFSVLINNGDGTFAPKVDYTAGAAYTAVADFNKDGNMDIVTQDNSVGFVSVFMGNGDGTFAPKVDYTAGDSSGIVAADFNKDGNADIVIATWSSGIISVLLNNGDGTFAPKVDYAAAGHLEHIIMADFNKDGSMDVATPTRDGGVTVLLNNGDGTFAPKVSYTTGGGPRAFAADLDGDGNIDIITANFNDSDISVLINNGDGTFAPTVNYAGAAGATAGATADLDGDGDPDMVIANSTASTISVFTNTTVSNSRLRVMSIGGNLLFNISKTGAVTLQNSTDSADALKIQNSSGTTVLKVDTTTGTLAVDSISSLTSASTLTIASTADLDITGTININQNVNSDVNINTGTSTGMVTIGGSSVLLQNIADTTTALQIKNVAGGTVVAVDTSNKALVVGTLADTSMFGSSVLYPAGTDTTDLTSADFNGDGKKDIATRKYSSYMSVQMNNGDGTFLSPVDYVTGSADGQVTSADVNRDGHVDIITSNITDNTVSIFINNGNGTFATKVDYTAGTTPAGIVAADFNNDSYPDIIVANYSTTTMSVFINNGDGTFAAKVDYTIAVNTNNITYADFNKDGKLDIAAVAGGLLSVLSNNGDGTFASKVDYAAGGADIATGDFNGDGYPDLVTTITNTTVKVSLNNGDGTFAAGVLYVDGTGTYGVAVADFNGDGKQDIVATDFTGVAVILGNGDGTFGAYQSYAIALAPSVISVDDFDGNGTVDIAAEQLYRNYVAILLNKTLAVKYDKPASVSVYVNGSGADAIRVNGVNNSQLFKVDAEGSTTIGGKATNTGMFDPKVEYATSNDPGSIATADFNGDGYIDTAISEGPGSGKVAILLNNGDNTFASRVEYSLGGPSPFYVVAADLNNDGYPDLITANYYSGSIAILFNNGDGTFAPRVFYFPGSSPLSVVTADFNKDGYIDVATTSPSGGNMSILLNNGDGTLAASVDYATVSDPANPVVADFNGDGNIDLATSGYNTHTVSVLFGNGDGTFAPKVDYSTGLTATYSTMIATADFNGDGHMDLVTTNHVSSIVSVLLNNGDGTFATHVDYPAASSADSVVTADINGDGKMDLVTIWANIFGGSEAVLYGNGDGTFAAKVDNVLGTEVLTFITPLDVDQDGDPDILALNGFANKMYIYHNTRLSSSRFRVMDVAGTNQLFNVSKTGNTSIRNTVDSSDAFRVQNSSGATILKVDTLTDSLKVNNLSALTSSATLAITGNINLNVNTNSNTNINTGTSTGMVTVGGSGVVLQNIADTTSALQIKNTVGHVVVTADTANTALTVGSTAASTSNLFLPKTDYAIGSNAQGIVTADFNKDGKNDVVTADTSSDNVSVLLGNGNGTFAAKVDYPTGAAPVKIATADFNKDGKLDLVVTNHNSGTVSILMGNGDGTFASKIDYAAMTFPTGVTTGDFNGDGNIDIAATNEFSATLSIYINNGNGTFAPQVNYTAGGGTVSVVSVDLNGDGKPDLATAGFWSMGVAIFINNGDGTFAGKVEYTTAVNTADIAYADINKDGKVDLVAADQSSATVSVLLGNGNGTFAAKVDYVTGVGPTILGLSDLNEDGTVDIAVVNQTSNTVSLLAGNGDGTFAPKVDYATGTGPWGIVATDLDNNGNNDLAITNYTSSTVSVLLNKSLAVKATVPATVNVYANSNGADVIRVVGAANAQLFKVDAQGSTTIGGTTTSTGMFDAKVDYPGQNGSSPATTADLNNDGHTDLITIKYGATQTVSIYINNGDGTYAPRVDYDVAGALYVVAADLNNDGYIDLALSVAGASILFNNGDGTFAPQVNYTVGIQSGTIAAADFNKDGWVDLVTTNYFGNNMSVFMNNGDGTFAANIDYAFVTHPTFITSADLNKDGYPDLIELLENTNNVSVSINNGDGTFAPKVDYPTGTTQYHIAVTADFNHDGNVDIATNNRQDNTVSVLLGNGDGTFATKVDYATGTNPNYIATADFNGDGSADLILSNYAASTMSVLLNNGNGTFATKADYPVGPYPSFITAADLDDDGDQDVALLKSSDSMVSVYYNTRLSSSRLRVMDIAGTSQLFNISKAGSVTFQNITSSSSAFAVKNATGINLLNVDTNNSTIQAGNTLFVDGANNRASVGYAAATTKLNVGEYTDVAVSLGIGSDVYENTYGLAAFGNNLKLVAPEGFRFMQGSASGTEILKLGGPNGTATFQNSSDSTSALQIKNAAGTNTVLNVDTTNGNVGIDNTAPSYSLHVGSSAVASGTTVARFENAGGTCDVTPNTAGGITCTSDIRLKKDITGISTTNALNKLLGISTISYHLNAETSSDQLHTGFSAQQLESVLPDLVVTNNDGYKSVSYAGVTPYLVAGIQEQQSKIDTLTSSVALLQNATNITADTATITNLSATNLTVTGNATFTGTLTVKDITVANITIAGHIITAGNTPTITVGTAAGIADPAHNITAPIATIDGNDTAGTITITVGANTTAGELVQISFSMPFGKVPKVVLNAGNADTTDLKYYRDADTTSFRVKLSQPAVVGQTYSFDYIVVQ